jgi:hypothetical protein
VETVLSSLTSAERKKKISRDKRLSRYEEVMVLHREGVGQRAIARHRRHQQEYRAALCLLDWLSGTGRRFGAAWERREQAGSLFAHDLRIELRELQCAFDKPIRQL